MGTTLRGCAKDANTRLTTTHVSSDSSLVSVCNSRGDGWLLELFVSDVFMSGVEGSGIMASRVFLCNKWMRGACVWGACVRGACVRGACVYEVGRMQGLPQYTREVW